MASCRKIGSFVDELRGYARSVDGDPREEVGIRRIVDGALQLTNHQILRATHSFRVDVGADLPPLQGSVRRLQQVIINLIEGSCFSYLERQRRCALQIVAGYDPGSRMITVRIEAEGPLDEGGRGGRGRFPGPAPQRAAGLDARDGRLPVHREGTWRGPAGDPRTRGRASAPA